MRMKTMSQGGLRGFVSLTLVAMFVMASQNAAAITVTGAIVGGKTEIYNAGMPVYCDAAVWTIRVSSTVDINDGDDVVVEYRAYWWDNRTYLAAQYAYHNFTLEVFYAGSYYGEDHHYAVTIPNQYGSHTVSVTVTGALVGRTILYYYNASIIAPPPGMYTCSDSDGSSGSFTLT